MVDSKNIISLPPKVRFALLAFLLLIFFVSAWLVLSKVGDDGYRDWVVVAMSVLQMASTGLIIALVVFFAEADVSVNALQQKTEHWLRESLPKQLRKMSLDDDAVLTVSVVRGVRDIFGCQYEVMVARRDSPAETFIRFWVGLNVNRLIVIYWADGHSEERLAKVFKETFKGAESVGWSQVILQPEHVGGHAVTSMWTTWMQQGESFLKTPEMQLFVAQDIAMMTQSVIRSASRNGVSLVVADEWPRPL